jgi:hypothetical protein
MAVIKQVVEASFDEPRRCFIPNKYSWKYQDSPLTNRPGEGLVYEKDRSEKKSNWIELSPVFK